MPDGPPKSSDAEHPSSPSKDEAQAEAARLAAFPKAAYVATKRSLRRDTITRIRERFDANLEELLRPPA